SGRGAGAPPLPPGAPGGSPHQSLPGRADPAPSLPAADAPDGRRSQLHDLAPAPRPDGDADDRHADRHGRLVGSRVPRADGRAPQGVPGPLGARELLHPPLGASEASRRRPEPDGIQLPAMRKRFTGVALLLALASPAPAWTEEAQEAPKLAPELKKLDYFV